MANAANLVLPGSTTVYALKDAEARAGLAAAEASILALNAEAVYTRKNTKITTRTSRKSMNSTNSRNIRKISTCFPERTGMMWSPSTTKSIMSRKTRPRMLRAAGFQWIEL